MTRGHTGRHGDALRTCSLHSPGTSRSQQLAATGLPHALLAKSCSSAGRAPTSSPGRTSQMNKNLPRAVSVPVHSFGWHIRVTEGFFSTLPRYTTVSMRLMWQSTWTLTRSFPMNFSLPSMIQPHVDSELALPKKHLQQLCWLHLGWLPGPHPAALSPSSSKKPSWRLFSIFTFSPASRVS